MEKGFDAITENGFTADMKTKLNTFRILTNVAGGKRFEIVAPSIEAAIADLQQIYTADLEIISWGQLD